MTYTIKRERELTDELVKFICAEASGLNKLFGGKYNWFNMAVQEMLDKGIFLVGYKKGEIRGIHVSFLVNHPLDRKLKVLQQQIFYVKPDSGRMAFHLFNKFIDIGRSEADHIITMLTRHTNIKSETLINKGFEEIQVTYRLESKK
jgi:hypothetical protein